MKGGVRALHSLVTMEPTTNQDIEVMEFDIAALDIDEGNQNHKDIAPPPEPYKDGYTTVMSKRAKKNHKKLTGPCKDTCCKDISQLGVLETISPTEEVNTVGEWEELLMAVDSGATETVVSSDNAKSVPTVSGPASKSGVKYSTANGEVLDNEGEKHMLMSSLEGVNRAITAQVTEVNKPLLSVSKMVKAGNTVTFSPEGSYIYDGYTGEVMQLEESKGLYWLKMWVQSSSGF